MITSNLNIKADYIGATAGFLCLLHCIATPFIFFAKSCASSCCAEAPMWWHFIDAAFLGISFLAIRQSLKSTSQSWMKMALWGSWGVLLLVMGNEKIGLVALPDEAIYAPALLIMFLHIYNLKFCQCAEDTCCVQQ